MAVGEAPYWTSGLTIPSSGPAFGGPLKSNVRHHTVHLCHTPEAVASAISFDTTRVIAIDGFQGSGKTTLARALSEQWNIPVVSADNYLIRNQGAFFNSLRIEWLSAALGAHERYIFEGVCCLQVLQAIGVNANVLVYVKRMAAWGWADEDELASFASAPSSTAEETPPLAEIRDPLQITLRDLWEEVAQYHWQYRPHEVADLSYERSAA